MLATEMPVHQLAKRGEEELRIIRRDRKDGQITDGLDTWVIERLLDRMPRPIPRLLGVGDLCDIARQVNHGGDTNAMKRVFEQDASAFIRATAMGQGAEKLEVRSKGRAVKNRWRASGVVVQSAGISTSVTLPGVAAATAAEIAGSLFLMSLHRPLPRTTIAMVRPARFCWCRRFRSVVRNTSNPAASAASSNSPFRRVSQPRERASSTV